MVEKPRLGPPFNSVPVGLTLPVATCEPYTLLLFSIEKQITQRQNAKTPIAQAQNAQSSAAEHTQKTWEQFIDIIEDSSSTA
jgi:hypothetical protein